MFGRKKARKTSLPPNPSAPAFTPEVAEVIRGAGWTMQEFGECITEGMQRVGLGGRSVSMKDLTTGVITKESDDA